MQTHIFRYAAVLLTATGAARLSAQPAVTHDSTGATGTAATVPAAPSSTTTPAKDAATMSVFPPITLQHYRPQDQRGVNVFEPPKDDTVPFTHPTVSAGGAFLMEYQALAHSNSADDVIVVNSSGKSVNANRLMPIGPGFANPVANLYVEGQLAHGIRVSMTTYLSARHHQDTWVKDGYLLIDASPIDIDPLNTLMKYVTIRAGDFEVNYGDAHFRRTDNGQGMFNPLVGNYIMDAFTNEIGAEVYVRANGFLAMAGVTNGQNKGAIQTSAPSASSHGNAPSLLGKLGFDRQLSDELRVRLTGSAYVNNATHSNTLYSGDRAGSVYYDVMENTQSSETNQAWSGALQPGLTNKVRAMVINPFIKFGGLELFGNLEQATGRGNKANGTPETADRTWHQNVGEVVYRLPGDLFYVVGRYNTASGRLAGMTSDVSINRTQFGGGWFILPTVQAKVEYMRQLYNDFPSTDIRHGGKINGLIFSGVVAF